MLRPRFLPMASDPRQPRDLSPLPPLFCGALWPLGLLYGLAVRLRGLLYRLEVLKARRLGAPVVSVGDVGSGLSGQERLQIRDLLTRGD